MDGNPKIIKDSLAMMPAIDQILEMAQTGHIADPSIDDILEQTRTLRDAAAGADLIEPPETGIKSMDRDLLRCQFTRLMRDLETKAW